MTPEPTWIHRRDAPVLHERPPALNGGPAGVRDDGLLHAALARPRRHLAHAADAGTVRLAAPQAAGIVRERPFLDGNRRTGLVPGVLLLGLNGHAFAASEGDAAAQAVIALAAGTLDEAGYAACGSTSTGSTSTGPASTGAAGPLADPCP